jgi:hypothetical protein
MRNTTNNTSRTEHLLALMKKGDDAFNARDFGAVDAVHHPDMVAHITGNAQPIYGSVAHAAAIQQMLRIFPDMHVTPRMRSSSEAATGSPWSPAPRGHSPGKWSSPTAM